MLLKAIEWNIWGGMLECFLFQGATVALRKGIQQHIHTVMKTAYMCLHIHVLPRLLPIVLVTFCPMHVVTAIDIFWKFIDTYDDLELVL